jgi:putative FmdB family regulatory protein
MPLYEYRCEACGQRFEVIQKFSEVSETCRLCGKGPVERLQSAPGIQFKGSGWYVTDYAQKGKSSSDAAASGKSDSSEAGGSKKTEGGSGETSSKTESTAPSTTSTTPTKT